MKELSEQDIAGLLAPLAPFLYWPNFGNLGDLLIAEGTRQFFEKHGLRYQEFESLEKASRDGQPVSLVFAGGARFTANWCSPDAEEALLSPMVETAVVLPHSINGVDALMQRLRDNCHLICREGPTYEYCASAGTGAHLYLADDMALGLRLDILRPAPLDLPREGLNGEELRTQTLLKEGWAENLRENVRRASANGQLGGKWRKVAFLLRRDSERNVPYRSPFTFDISSTWNTSGRRMCYNANMLLAFADAVREADAVVTDRLHVAVMCWKAGVEVYMLDNSYRKLSGVYRKSLSREPSIHLLADGRFTPEIERAWKRLNSPVRLARWHALSLCRKGGRKLQGLAKRLGGH